VTLANRAARFGLQLLGWLKFQWAGARLGVSDRVGRLIRRSGDQSKAPGTDRYIPAYDPRLPRGRSTYGPPDD
jgi:hypothetical protein